MPSPTHYTYPTAPPSLLVALRDFLAQKVFSTAPHEEERGDRSVKVFSDGSILYDDTTNRKMLRNVRPALATEAAATAHADQLREKIASIQRAEKQMNELLGGSALLPDGLRHDTTTKQYEPDGAWYWNVRYALWLRPAQGEVPVPVLGAGLEFDLSPGGQVLRMHSTTLPVMKPRKVEGFKMLDTTGPPSPPPTEGDKAEIEDTSNSIIFLRNERGYVAHHVSKEKGYVPVNADGIGNNFMKEQLKAKLSSSTSTAYNFIFALDPEAYRGLDDTIIENKLWYVLPPAQNIMQGYELLKEKMKEFGITSIDTFALVHHGGHYGIYTEGGGDEKITGGKDTYADFYKRRSKIEQECPRYINNNGKIEINPDYEDNIIWQLSPLGRYSMGRLRAMLTLEKIFDLIKDDGTYISIGCQEYDATESLSDISGKRINLLLNSNLTSVNIEFKVTVDDFTPKFIDIGTLFNINLTSKNNFSDINGWYLFNSKSKKINPTGKDLAINSIGGNPFEQITNIEKQGIDFTHKKNAKTLYLSKKARQWFKDNYTTSNYRLWLDKIKKDAGL